MFPPSDVMSSREGFRANRFPAPGSAKARKMCAISGRQCAPLLNDANPLGCCVKMLLESSTWNSTIASLIWKTSVTPSNRLLFQLVPSTPSTDATEFGFWPTVTNQDGKNNAGPSQFHRNSLPLNVAVKLCPTPCLPNNGGTNGKKKLKAMFATATCKPNTRSSPGHGEKLFQQVVNNPNATTLHGRLNPQFVEWFMGFPNDHTKLKKSTRGSSASETPSSRKSRKKSPVASTNV